MGRSTILDQGSEKASARRRRTEAKRTRILEVARRVSSALGLDLTPELPGRFRLGDVRHIFADSTRLRALGWNPHVSLDEGIAHFVDWFRDHGAVEEIFGKAERSLLDDGLVRDTDG